MYFFFIPNKKQHFLVSKIGTDLFRKYVAYFWVVSFGIQYISSYKYIIHIITRHAPLKMYLTPTFNKIDTKEGDRDELWIRLITTFIWRRLVYQCVFTTTQRSRLLYLIIQYPIVTMKVFEHKWTIINNYELFFNLLPYALNQKYIHNVMHWIKSIHNGMHWIKSIHNVKVERIHACIVCMCASFVSHWCKMFN